MAKRILCCIVVLSLLMLVGCSGDDVELERMRRLSMATMIQATPEPTPAQEQLMRLPMPLEGGVWNPLDNKSQAMQGLMQLVYEPLVALDASLKPTPGLAAGWEMGVDGSTWTIKLRAGVKFQDGTDLVAQDVVDTLNAIATVGEEGPYAWILPLLLSWRVVDDATLSITATRQGYSTLFALAFPIIRDVGGEALPLGTGPYRVAGYVEGSSLDLQIQAHWWRDPPAIQRVRALARESAEAELNTFALGELDLIKTRSLTAELYRTEDVSEAQDYMTQGYEMLFFNFDRPMVADRKFRDAVAGAIDRADLIKNIYQGHALLSDIPIPPDSWMYDAKLLAHTYDPTQSREMLLGMGFVDSDDDGLFDMKPPAYRTQEEEVAQEEGKAAPAATPTPSPKNAQGSEAPQENPLEDFLAGYSAQDDPSIRGLIAQPIVLLTNYDQENPVRRDAAERIAAHLRAVGLQVQVDALPLAQLPQRLAEGTYDIVLLGFQMPLSGDLGFLLSPDAGEMGGNTLTHFDHPAIAELLRAPGEAVGDVAYRAAVLDIASFLIQEMPLFGLYFRHGTMLRSSKLTPPGQIREEAPYRRIEQWSFGP